MTFNQIPGLEDIKKHLTDSVKSGHVAHAQMFHASEGGAGLALALAYLTYLNCTDKQEEDACGKCPSCRKMEKLVHPDFHPIYPVTSGKKEHDKIKFLEEFRAFVLDNPYANLIQWSQHIAAENKQTIISVEESRMLIRHLSLKAFEAEFKMILIWLPETMNPASANAILKVLEEPPEKTIFILVTQNLPQIMATIISRCQITKIPDFQSKEVAAFLESRGIENNKNLETIAAMADGDMNRALEMVQQQGSDSSDFFVKWMRHCFKLQFSELSQMAADFQNMPRESQKNVFRFGLSILRESLVTMGNTPSIARLPKSQQEFIANFSKALTLDKVAELSDHFNKNMYFVDRNANPKILFMDVSASIARLFKS